MARTHKLSRAYFLDQADSNILKVTFEIFDDADPSYLGGSISYDFEDAAYSVQGIDDLAQAALIKAKVDAMIASRLKSTISLPSLVESNLKRDINASVLDYYEVY